MYSVQMVSTTHYYLPAASFKLLALWERWAEHTFEGQGKGQEPSIALVQLVGQLGVMCS